jgi:hypothetical protein
MSRSPDSTPAVMTVVLDRGSIEALADTFADRLIGRLTQPRGVRLLDSHELGEQLGRRSTWVRQHADELGAIRFGEGSRPRLLFDLDSVLDRLDAARGCPGRTTDQLKPDAAPSGRVSQRAVTSRDDLLPMRGSQEQRASSRRGPTRRTHDQREQQDKV